MTFCCTWEKLCCAPAFCWVTTGSFLRNKRFHHYNRFYLQSTLLVSVLLPFFRIPVLYQPQNAVNQAVYETIEVLTVNYGEEDVMGAGADRMAKLLTLENAGYLLYVTGIVVLLWMLVRSLLYIRRISKQYPFERISGLKFFTNPRAGYTFLLFQVNFLEPRTIVQQSRRPADLPP